jgi:DNA-binding response OmpR family regulator
MKTLLVVEDDDIIRESIHDILEAEGYSVQSAADGRAGADIAKKMVPDLIISDIMMPVLTGYEMLHELREYPPTAHVPFLFLSAKTDRGSIREGMNSGADDFISKPFEINELLDAVSAQLQKHQTRTDKVDKAINQLRKGISESLPHELRTPLSAILGLSELILWEIDTISREDLKDLVTKIHDAGKRLHRTNENILLYASLNMLESDAASMQKIHASSTYSALDIINGCIHEKASEYHRQNDFQIEVQDACLAIDAEHLSDLLLEILDNACKFSDKATPIKVQGYCSNASMYMISIQDEGRGMSPVQIASSGAFMQFDRSFYEQQGSGLGISIARKICSLYNGHYSMTSEIGKGTKVFVELPLAKLPEFTQD